MRRLVRTHTPFLASLSLKPGGENSFQQTNQTSLLNTPNAPAVVDGMRKVCALASTLLGGVAYTDGEATPTSSVYLPPSATATASGARAVVNEPVGLILVVLGAVLVMLAQGF